MILAPHLLDTGSWLRDFDRFFDAAFRPEAVSSDTLRVLEDDQGWTLELDLPGRNRDELKLDFRDRALVLSVDGNETRSFPLGKRVDETAVTATFENGVLSVRLPKADPNRGTRTIDIL